VLVIIFKEGASVYLFLRETGWDYLVP
jgi:hypothetical protein